MASNDQLFSSLISDIKSYTGKDPLLPWLQGIRKLKESLPPHVLKAKVPRFLQRCVRTFEGDQRYRNDLRYLRVWIQLMDYVDEPKVLLRTMEENQIGAKCAIFYQAYALYYEKMKKFEESEKMYHLGVRNLAEPAGELQKSYVQFLRRLELYKRRKTKRQEAKAAKRTPFDHRDVNIMEGHHRICEENSVKLMEQNLSSVKEGQKNPTNDMNTREKSASKTCLPSNQDIRTIRLESEKPTTFCGDDTVVVKFVGSAIVGKTEAEEACHHGLVDPTINMKEAMNAINSMFQEPLELELNNRRSQRSQTCVNQPISSEFKVFVDESEVDRPALFDQKTDSGDLPTDSGRMNGHNSAKVVSHFGSKTEAQKPLQEPLKIFCDDGDNGRDSLARNDASMLSVHPLDSSNDQDTDDSSTVKLRDDTIVCRFVGSTILGEPEVENACHHGLVDPTINMKEAMDDINSMFGKPLDFAKGSRPKRQNKLIDKRQDFYNGFSVYADEDLGQQQQKKTSMLLPKEDSNHGLSIFVDVDLGQQLQHKKSILLPKQDKNPGFSIYADEDLGQQQQHTKSTLLPKQDNNHGFSTSSDEDLGQQQQHKESTSSPSKLLGMECDLFEPTVFTKEAMDEINAMFGMPINF